MRTLSFLAVALLMLSSCFAVEGSDRVLQQNEISSFKVADTHLPATASNARVYETRFQDTLMFLTFEASEADARRFATEVLRTPPRHDGFATLSGGDMAPSWWQPRRTPQSEAGNRHDGQQQISLDLLLVPAAGRATVWLRGGWPG